MAIDRQEWEEKRVHELHRRASAMRVKARVNVGYYEENAKKLNTRLRWIAAISAISGVAVAAAVPAVRYVEPVREVPLAEILVAMVALVAPVLMGWAKAKGWAGDLSAYLKARDMSHALELEYEILVERLELRDFESPADIIRQYHHLQQRWELVGNTTPPEIPDVERIRLLREKAERSLGLKKDACEQPRATETAS